MNRLRGPKWLNNDLIAFIFRYNLCERFKEHSAALLYVPASITQLIKLLPEDAQSTLAHLGAEDKQILFFAVSDHVGASQGGSHWSLLVFSRAEKTFFYLDSIGTRNISATSTLVEILKNTLECPMAPLIAVESLQQTNSYDCGIIMVANVEMICDFYLANKRITGLPIVAMEVVVRKRGELLNIIQGLKEGQASSGLIFLTFLTSLLMDFF